MDEQEAAVKAHRLDELAVTIGNCTRCKLHRTRSTVVFGEGNPAARVMFIGEGPGRDEDLQGRPFVGRAGQLLTAIIEKGMLLKRSDVYIANVVKCRPTENMQFVKDRPPDDEEKNACGQFLLKQIEIIKPEVIVTLGNPSTQFLLRTKLGITKARGQWHSFNGIAVMPTYHPSYVLRNGDEASPLKRDVWEDIKKVLARLDNPGNGPLENSEPRKGGAGLDSLRDEKEKDSEVQGKLF
jgi:DNA polymerase